LVLSMIRQLNRGNGCEGNDGGGNRRTPFGK
jgi:hypothetical protein